MPLIKTLKNPKALLIAGIVFMATVVFGIYFLYGQNSKYNKNIPTVRGAVSTSTWVGGTTGNWSEASNWDNGVPTTEYNVLISSSTAITVTATGTLNFADLTIGGGSASTTLVLTGNIGTGTNITLAVNGVLQQNNAIAQSISGDLLIQSGGILTHSANVATQTYILDFSANNI